MKNKTQIFADGADIQSIKKLLKNKKIKGFTTNPSLMRKSGIKNYEKFSKQIAKLVYPKSISLEVFSDDIEEMYDQAKVISSWGKNVFVKIPVINTHGTSTSKIIKKLSNENIKLNITAVFTENQINVVTNSINPKSKVILSVFAGRIADSGRNPLKQIKYAIKKTKNNKNHQVLWASTREAYNIIEANKVGCDIITVSPDILKKMKNFNKSLLDFSKDTVKMFYDDAKSSGYKI